MSLSLLAVAQNPIELGKIVTAATLLFFIMDPIGNTPVCVSLLKKVAPERAQKVIFREFLFALAVLVFFLFAGSTIMKYLDVSMASLSVSGGVVLFLIAVQMVFGDSHNMMGTKEQFHGEPLFVPIAVPLIAGPSAMAMLLLFVSREPELWFSWLIALILAWVISLLVVFNATRLLRSLGERGITAVQHLIGMLLVVISVEMVLKGIREAIKNV
ncbi:MAG: MarC family protein [Planctomycetia bacterium]|jgi:multiple antibiotic resistance protein